MYDCIIIGGGIAGLTAGIYCGRAGIKALILEGELCGGQILSSPEVENYPGFFGSGYELAEITEKQAISSGTEIAFEEAEDLSLFGDIKKVGSHEGKTVIIATGAKHRKAGFEGEERLSGAGISYCALCDGAFFKGKETAVIGGADSAVSEALYLSKICKKVYLIYRRDKLRAEAFLINKLQNTKNIELITNTAVKAAVGDKKLEKIITDRGELSLSGLFVSAGLDPNTEKFRSIIDTDESGYIKTDNRLRTSLSGVFAAGDCRKKTLRQLVTAAADGALAAREATDYLKE